MGIKIYSCSSIENYRIVTEFFCSDRDQTNLSFLASFKPIMGCSSSKSIPRGRKRLRHPKKGQRSKTGQRPKTGQRKVRDRPANHRLGTRSRKSGYKPHLSACDEFGLPILPKVEMITADDIRRDRHASFQAKLDANKTPRSRLSFSSESSCGTTGTEKFDSAPPLYRESDDTFSSASSGYAPSLTTKPKPKARSAPPRTFYDYEESPKFTKSRPTKSRSKTPKSRPKTPKSKPRPRQMSFESYGGESTKFTKSRPKTTLGQRRKAKPKSNRMSFESYGGEQTKFTKSRYSNITVESADIPSEDFARRSTIDTAELLSFL